MIESIQETPVVLASNSAFITFSVDDIRTRSANCCDGWLAHREGSPLYQLLKCGYYDVTFKVVVTSATEGIVAFGLYEDGVLSPGTLTAATITTAGDVTTLNFTTTLPVCGKANTTIAVASVPSVPDLATITGPGIATQIPTIASANLTIEKRVNYKNG